MSLFEKRFKIQDCNGKHSLTAKKLYDRVSNYGLIAPAVELVRVCNEPDFPVEYARGIEIIILIHSTKFETNRGPRDCQDPTEAEAVNFCYNSLAEVSERANKVREEHLWAVIRSVSKYHFSPYDEGFNHHHGPTYCKIREDWEAHKFEQYCSIAELNFEELRDKLNESFDRTMKNAERRGLFRHDDVEFRRKSKEDMEQRTKAIWNLQDYEF